MRDKPLANMKRAAYNCKSPSSANTMACAQRTRGSVCRASSSLFIGLCFFVLAAGCGQEPPTQSAQQETAKPAEPAVPQEIQDAADSLLGSDTQVLLFGDLAKNGENQFLAANILPKTPKNQIPGTIVTRAAIAEKEGDNWKEIFSCDEHLKNQEGYLGMTPLEPITGWRLQYEQDPKKGLLLFFTPVKGNEDVQEKPIGEAWNQETKRYQTHHRTNQHI